MLNIKTYRNDDGEEPTVISRGYHRFMVGHVAEGDEGRQEHGGPMVPGPWAYAFGLCIAISDPPVPRPTAHPVADGELIEVAGHTYRVRYHRSEWLELELVD